MKRVNLEDMISDAAHEYLKSQCHHCSRQLEEHYLTMVDGYEYFFCPGVYGQTFFSELLMTGNYWLDETGDKDNASDGWDTYRFNKQLVDDRLFTEDSVIK